MEIVSPEDWEDYGMNGRFQSCIAGTSRVFHCDQQRFAGIVYLTPDAPVGAGTSMMQHKETKLRHSQEEVNGKNINAAFNQDTFVDPYPYEMVDTAGNVFNRLVIFDTHDFSYHGLPDPVNFPDKNPRKSIILYYYTKEKRPNNQVMSSKPHSALWVKKDKKDKKGKVERDFS